MTGLVFVAACLLVVPMIVVYERPNRRAARRVLDVVDAEIGSVEDPDDPVRRRGALRGYTVSLTVRPVRPIDGVVTSDCDAVVASVEVPGLPEDLDVSARNVSVRDEPVGPHGFDRCRIVAGSATSQRWLTDERRSSLLRAGPSRRRLGSSRTDAVVEVSGGAIHRTLPLDPAKAVAAVRELADLGAELERTGAAARSTG